MNVIRRLSLFAISALPLVGISAPAHSESARFCQRYAQAAVDSFTQSQSQRCGFSGPRWNADRDAEYRWCLTVPASRANFETTARANQLRVCRHEPKARSCNEYAINAVSRQKSNLSGRCRFSGPRWNDNYDIQLAWCMKARPEAVKFESNVQFAMLGVCSRQQPFLRCDGYAKRAVAQAREARARRCGFTGNRWGDFYEGHLSWCIGVSEQFANSETRAREGPLSQCRTTHPVGRAPAVEACAWTSTVKNRTCRNLDGTASSIVPGSMSANGCGGNAANAAQRAKLNFSVNVSCLSDGNSPAPGCCTFSVQTARGCGC